MNSSQVTIRDLTLHVVEQGSGTPLLLVHGFPLDHQMWLGQIQDLAEDFHVIAPDLRGFGNSQHLGETVTMERFADDLAELLDAMSISQPVILGGLSMGGYVAWQFWRRHRDRLSHLVLCDTRAIPDTVEAAATRRETADLVLQQGPAILIDAMVNKLFAPQTIRQKKSLIDETVRIIEAAPAEGIAAALRGMAQRVDATPWLPEIDVPTLVLCGQHDAISSVSEMQGIAESIPDSQFAVIPAAGHMAPLEAAIHVNKTIREFLGTPRRA